MHTLQMIPVAFIALFYLMVLIDPEVVIDVGEDDVVRRRTGGR